LGSKDTKVRWSSL